MLENLTSFVSSFGYIGIFLIMMFNSDFVPLFTEATLPFAGFLASQGALSVMLIIVASVLGDLVGGIIAYYIGYFLEETVILTAVKKYGKFIFLKEKDYIRTTNLLQKYGSPIVFFAKLTPGLKAWTSVASGICKIQFRKYILASVLASIIYNSTLVLLGYHLGKNWLIIAYYFNKFQTVVFALLIFAVLLFVFRRINQRKNQADLG